MTKHRGEALVGILCVGSVGFLGVTEAFQKVGLGDSAPYRCKQVRLKSVVLRVVVTLMNLVAIHLKDVKRGEVRVFKNVVELQVGVEGGPLGVAGDGPAVEDFAAAHG